VILLSDDPFSASGKTPFHLTISAMFRRAHLFFPLGKDSMERESLPFLFFKNEKEQCNAMLVS
jgi:hypothetical protein